jgi:hypothetical protein
MAINNIATTVRNSMIDSFVDAIDAGSSDTTGDIQIYTASSAVLLSSLTFSNPAFGAATNGSATAGTIADDKNCAASGTAAIGLIRDRDNTLLARFSIGTSGEDLNLNTTTIAAGDTLQITSMTISMAAS